MSMSRAEGSSLLPGIPEMIGDIPGTLFNPGDGRQQSFQTPQGVLSCAMGGVDAYGARVEFSYPGFVHNGNRIHFIAVVERDSYGKPYEVEMYARNRFDGLPRGSYPKLPLIRDLAAVSLHYFGLYYELNRFQVRYYPGSDTYADYQNARARGLTPEEAARLTGGGILAIANGFGEVADIDEKYSGSLINGTGVCIVFERETPVEPGVQPDGVTPLYNERSGRR